MLFSANNPLSPGPANPSRAKKDNGEENENNHRSFGYQAARPASPQA
jgi:hypothetical protein